MRPATIDYFSVDTFKGTELELTKLNKIQG